MDDYNFTFRLKKPTIFLRDPITEEKVPVENYWLDNYAEFSSFTFSVPKESYKLFALMNKEPLRYQNYPFFLDLTDELRTELIKINHITNFEKQDNQIRITATFDNLDNLEFIKQIQYQRWLHPNE